MSSLFLTTGPKVRSFEAALADFLGVAEVVGVSSCTDALIVTLAALDIGHGDEVITTPMTFSATSNAVLLRGSRPVFADVDPATGNIDTEAVRKAITGRTKAIICVHLYGHMCDVAGLRKLAHEHNLFLIEDAAHCVDGHRGELRPGRVGDVACFSFYATKNLTSGEGGAIATNDSSLAERLRSLRSHGLDRGVAERHRESSYRHWDQLYLGYKANLTDLQAALLLPQLPGIGRRLERRKEIAARYREGFKGIPMIALPEIEAGVESAYHLFTIWVPAEFRDFFLTELGRAEIGVAVNYRPVHLTTYYRRELGFAPGAFPVAESIGSRTVSLPMYPGLEDKEVDYVIRTVIEISERVAAADREPS